MEVITNTKLRNFIVVGISKQVGPSLFKDPLPVVLGIYETVTPYEAYKLFLSKYCSNIRDAQRFYNKINVIEIADTAEEFLLSDTFGELAKFPNETLFTDEDYYY